MKKIICLLLAGFCVRAGAQTYRMVNGQVYRADDPSAWRLFSDVHVIAIFPDGNLECTEVEDRTSSRVVEDIQPGRFSVKTTSHQRYGPTFVLKNYHSYNAPVPGMDIGWVKAMPVPSVISDPYSLSDPEECGVTTYDVGTPYYPPVATLTPAQIAAKRMAAQSNIVAFLKIQAKNGMPEEQRRLGERYLKGKGVPKDEAIGRMWLEASAKQGNLRASNDLVQLTLTNSVTAEKQAAGQVSSCATTETCPLNPNLTERVYRWYDRIRGACGPGKDWRR